MSEPTTDRFLGRRMLEAGLVTDEQLRLCRRELEDDAAAGRPSRTLGQVLVARGWITSERLGALLARPHDGAPPGSGDGTSPVPGAGGGDGPATLVALPERLPEHSRAFERPRPPDSPTLTGVVVTEHAAGPAPAPPDPSASSPSVAPSEARPGGGSGMFGRYLLEGEIARGGMGVVYRAYDTQVKRRVALKVIHGGDAVPAEARRRFDREAHLAARLHHPNIVAVYEVGEIDATPYFTMELVDGESLQAILQRMRRVPVRAALTIARDVARALEHSHGQNLIHRDIKPGNVLISRGGGSSGTSASESTLLMGGGAVSSFRVLVTDFGLVKDVGSQSALTREGNVLGTPMYMSPEQADGDVTGIGPASDVYSLGAVLYEMLCGQKPFAEASAVQLLAAVILEDPPPLRARAPELHPDLETIVAKAMEKDPVRRYASAKALADDIERYLSGEIIEARPAGWTYRSWRRLVRHRAVVAPLAVATFLVAGVLAWPVAQAAWEQRREREERAERERASAALLADARARAARGDEAGARAGVESFVREFGAAADRGERHAVAEAHALAAELHSRAGDEQKALRERFRAYRAAVRRGAARPFLLGMARELVEQGRFDEARGILQRAGEGGDADPVAAEAAYWQARVFEAAMDFEAAGAAFRRALAGPLPPALRAEADEHLALTDLLGGETTLPFPAGSAATGDLDGDGRAEWVFASGGGVRAGSLGPDGGWQDRCRFLPDAAEICPISAVHVTDLDGDGRAEVLAAGASDKRDGAVWVLAAAGDTFLVRAREPLRTQLPLDPFATGDLDGDGEPEVLVGTGPYERGIRIYTWHRKEGRLQLRGVQPMGGDVCRLAIQDVLDDANPEVVVAAGAWSAYALFVLRWTPQGFESLKTLRMGWPTSLLRVPGPDSREWIAGNLWYRGNLHPMQRILGARRFAETYRPPGVYRCRFDREDGGELEALEAGDWRDGDDGAYGVVLLRGAERVYLWVDGRMNGFADAPARESAAVPTGSVWVREGAQWRRLTRLATTAGSRFLSRGDAFQFGFQVVDLDGDGDDEVLSAAGTGTRVRGLRRFGASVGPAPAVSGTTAPSAMVSTLGPLDAARDAERVGLYEEALDTYARILQGPESPAEAFAAVQGRLRSLAELGRHGDLEREASAAARSWPDREQDLLAPCVDALCAARAWDAAARLAALQVVAPGLTPAQRRAAREREAELRTLAQPASNLVLVGPEAAGAIWLVSSAVSVRREGDDLLITAPTGAPTFCVTPLGASSSGFTLSGVLEPERLEWTSHFNLGFSEVAPWHDGGGAPATRSGLGFSASGDTGWPQRTVFTEFRGPNLSEGQTLLFRPRGLPARFEFSLAHVPHPSRLVGRLRFPPDAEVERIQPAGAPARIAYVGFFGSLGHEVGFWSRVRLKALEARCARPGEGLLAFAPVTPLEHLAAANGRWVFGTAADALPQYDLAVRLAEDEWTREEAHLAEGLPSPWRAAHPASLERWAAVDARIQRGLARWSANHPDGAREDLRHAWTLSQERVRRWIALHALELAERPDLSEPLSALWRERHGDPAGEALDRFAIETLKTFGESYLVFRVLFGPAGYTIERRVAIVYVEPDTPADVAGLRKGDIVVEFEGRKIQTAFELNDARIDAEERSLSFARVGVARDGAELEVDVPPSLEGVQLQESLVIGKR